MSVLLDQFNFLNKKNSHKNQMTNVFKVIFN